MEEVNKKESNRYLIVSVVVIVLFAAAIFTNGFGLLSQKTSEKISLSIGASPVLGEAEAKVIIYEFSDLSCPYCAAADGKNQEAINSIKASNPLWEPPIPKVIENYINTGKARMVFKYFPGHGSGIPAHMVGYCLNEQGLFWAFHEEAFANQEKIGDIVEMKKIAEYLGADMSDLESCLQSGKYSSALGNDTEMGKANGVRGTPTFIINGKIIEGAAPYSQFKAIIDEELN